MNHTETKLAVLERLPSVAHGLVANTDLFLVMKLSIMMLAVSK